MCGVLIHLVNNLRHTPSPPETHQSQGTEVERASRVRKGNEHISFHTGIKSPLQSDKGCHYVAACHLSPERFATDKLEYL